MKGITLFAVSIAGVVFSGVAPAATNTWTGGSASSANWTTPANWLVAGGIAPHDDLVFPAGTNRLANTNGFPNATGFRSLTISGGGYNIDGNSIGLSNGIRASAISSSAPRFNPQISMLASQTFSNSGTRPYILGGSVLMGGNVLTLAGSGDHRFDGNLTGFGSVSKSGAGIAVFNGNVPLTVIVANQGEVQINQSATNVQLNGGTLSGTGSVTRVVVLGNGGVISPGLSPTVTAELKVGSELNLNTNTVLHIEVNSPTEHDILRHFGSSMNLGGANLSVSLMSPPTNGAFFTIVTQLVGGTLSGRFAQNTSLVVSGRLFALAYLEHSVRLIAVSNQPSWTAASPPSGPAGVTLSGTSEYPYATYTVASSTSLALPPHLWPALTTNTFSSTGGFTFTHPPATGDTARFFHIRIP